MQKKFEGIFTGCRKAKRVTAAAVAGMFALTVPFTGVQAAEASEERTFYESDFVATGTEADFYNERMESLLDEIVTYFTETGELDKLAGYDEPLSFTTTGYYSSIFMDQYAKYEAMYGETDEKNRFNDLFKRLFNVDYTWNWRSLDADYTQKLNLDITSGALPDIFVVRDQSTVLSLAEQGLIWDMTDLIEEEAVDLLKNECLKSGDEAGLRAASVEGRVYGLPLQCSATDATSYLWIRKDWLDKLGLEAPGTIEELEHVMDAFMTQDPDGNGVDDTWGIFLRNDVEFSARGLFAAYGSYPFDWYEAEDGTVVYGATQENTKEALKKLAEWVQKGYINPESIAWNDTQALQDVINEKTGILYYPHWMPAFALSLFGQNPDADFRCYTLPSVTEGEDVKIMTTPAINGWVVVNKDFDHPELALKMMAISFFSIFEDNYGEWWNRCTGKDGEGAQQETCCWSPVRLPEYSTQNINLYKNLLKFKEAGYDESVLHGQAYSSWKLLQNTGDKYDWYAHLVYDPDRDGAAYQRIAEAEEAGNLFMNSFQGPSNQLMTDNMSAIVDAKNQMYVNVVYNQADADAEFEQWLATWDSLGGEEITAYVNEWCQENK